MGKMPMPQIKAEAFKAAYEILSDYCGCHADYYYRYNPYAAEDTRFCCQIRQLKSAKNTRQNDVEQKPSPKGISGT